MGTKFKKYVTHTENAARRFWYFMGINNQEYEQRVMVLKLPNLNTEEKELMLPKRLTWSYNQETALKVNML